jgi:hypothetical protein
MYDKEVGSYCLEGVSSDRVHRPGYSNRKDASWFVSYAIRCGTETVKSIKVFTCKSCRPGMPYTFFHFVG